MRASGKEARIRFMHWQQSSGDEMRFRSIRCRGVALAVVASLLAPASLHAESICGPGKELAPNAWACIPKQSRPRASSNGDSSNNAAAMVGAAAGLLGIIGALAGQMIPTDNVGRADLDLNEAGNASRAMNRSGFRNMQQGNFRRAATAFKMAAESARKAQNWKEADENDKNWAIAVAHEHLQTAVRAETDGDVAAASKAYHQAIVAAGTVGDQRLVKELQSHHDKLARQAAKSGKGKDVIPTDSYCATVNGVMRCQQGPFS